MVVYGSKRDKHHNILAISALRKIGIQHGKVDLRGFTSRSLNRIGAVVVLPVSVLIGIHLPDVSDDGIGHCQYISRIETF